MEVISIGVESTYRIVPSYPVFDKSYVNNTHLQRFTLDVSEKAPIIGRNLRQVMQTLFTSLALIVIISVLILKDQFTVGMAKVRVKK